MSSFTTRVLLLVAVTVPLAAVFYAVGALLAERSRILQRIGEMFLKQKDKSLEKWPLNRYAGLIRAGRMSAAAAMLTVLILVKSVACLVLGPIAVIWLPPACMTIPPLGRAFARAQQRSGAGWSGWMRNQTALQLGSHLAAGAIGASAWWGYMIGEGMPWVVVGENSLMAGALLVISAALAVIAGWYEASGHRRYELL